MISNIPRQLTEQETAPLIGYSISWLQRKRWEGGGPPFRKFGRSVRYPEDLLLKWIEEHRPLANTAGAAA